MVVGTLGTIRSASGRKADRERRVDDLFHALSDATRRDIVRRSIGGEHSVSALAGFYPMSFAAVQKHVAVLERAELVTKHRRGREQVVRSNIETIRTANHLLDQLESMWRSRMDRFGAVLDEDREHEKPPGPTRRRTDRGAPR